MAEFAGTAVVAMKPEQYQQRLSFELPDEATAMHFAQQIANACGATVTVVDAVGDGIGRATAQPCVARSGRAMIASLQKLADAMNAEVVDAEVRRAPSDKEIER
jgi:hypothetical protein